MKPINRIYITANQMSSRKLRPLSEYKGPILELTRFEKEDIARLQKQVFELEG